MFLWLSLCSQVPMVFQEVSCSQAITNKDNRNYFFTNFHSYPSSVQYFILPDVPVFYTSPCHPVWDINICQVMPAFIKIIDYRDCIEAGQGCRYRCLRSCPGCVFFWAVRVRTLPHNLCSLFKHCLLPGRKSSCSAGHERHMMQIPKCYGYTLKICTFVPTVYGSTISS